MDYDQQLRKIQQLKLEAVARAACSDNHYSDILPEVHQQTCELNEIDGELFDLVQIKATGWDDSVDPDDVPLGYDPDYEPQITDATDYPLLDNISGHIQVQDTGPISGREE